MLANETNVLSGKAITGKNRAPESIRTGICVLRRRGPIWFTLRTQTLETASPAGTRPVPTIMQLLTSGKHQWIFQDVFQAVQIYLICFYGNPNLEEK